VLSVIVKFVKNYAPYLEGEIAGFEEEVAKKLIDGGVAVVYKVKAVDHPEKDKMAHEPKAKK